MQPKHLDYRAMGFTLTSADVAQILGRSVPEVHDLVRVNELPALLIGETTFAEPRMLFHPDEVAMVEVRTRRLSDGSSLATDSRNRLRVLAALRLYLESAPATDDYDDALATGRPLWGNTRNGTPMLHVRAESVASYGPMLDGVTMPVSMVNAALEHFGAIRQRGVTPASAPGKQRWGYWFRLGDGFAPNSPEGEVIRGLATGAREDGERMTVRGGGKPHLAGTLGADIGTDTGDPVD